MKRDIMMESRRMTRLRPIIGLIIILFCLQIIPLGTALAQEEEKLVGQIDASTEDLSNLVNLLEDEKQRQAFVTQLKTLIEAKQKVTGEVPEAGPSGEAQAIEEFSDKIDSLSDKIASALSKPTQWLRQIPGLMGDISTFIKSPENLFDMVILLACTLAGILAGLTTIFLIKKHIPKRPDQRPRALVLIGLSLIRILLRTLPYAVSLIVIHLLFNLFPVLPQAQAFVLLIFWALNCYIVIIGAASHILSPLKPHLRLLPLKDADAVSLWRWTVRLIRYGLVYYILSEGLLVHIVDRWLFYFLRLSLTVIFPIMLSIILSRAARRIKEQRMPDKKLEEGVVEIEGKKIFRRKIVDLIIPFWHIPAIGYVWIVFIFQLGGYGDEFTYLFTATLGTLIISLGLLASFVGVDYLFQWFLDTGEAQEPKFVRVARLLVKAVLTLTALSILAYVWGLPTSLLLTSRLGSLIIVRFLVIALAISLLMVVLASSQAATEWLLTEKESVEPSQKRKTLVPVINATIKACAVFVTLIVVLDRLSVNVGPILAGAGIIGLGVGLGAQSLVKDFINGLFILFQDMIAVGDWIQLGDKSGEVESISLKAVRIRDISANVHIIPNSAIDTVTNMTRGYSRYIFDVGVAYRENVDEVMKILEEIGKSLEEDPQYARDIFRPLEVLGLNRFDDSAVIIRARITTRPMMQWAIGREFNRRMKKTFDERGIEIPFPHQTIYMGLPKEGEAPPLNLRRSHTPRNKEAGDEDKD